MSAVERGHRRARAANQGEFKRFFAEISAFGMARKHPFFLHHFSSLLLAEYIQQLTEFNVSELDACKICLIRQT